VILHIKILYSYSSNSRVPYGRSQEVGVDIFGEAGDHDAEGLDKYDLMISVCVFITAGPST
jgi:hypothetical protein